MSENLGDFILWQGAEMHIWDAERAEGLFISQSSEKDGFHVGVDKAVEGFDGKVKALYGVGRRPL